ncbi:peptide-binding protein, partial [candidate division CSSED10-310 bacterium]
MRRLINYWKQGDANSNVPAKKAVLSSTPHDTLLRSLGADPQYLNPVLSNDSSSSRVEELIYDQMLKIDSSPDVNLVGRLAERWEVSDDKLIITFYLRKGIQWHDGQDFTADDVKFTFDVAMREDVPAVGLQSTVETLNKIEVLDPYTVAFHFRYPFSPGLLRVGAVYIVPEHRLNEKGLVLETEQGGKKEAVTFMTTDFNRNPIGTGPYRFQEWKTSQRINLIRNENYWDKDNFPRIEKVMFKIIPNSTVSFNVLQKGELDLSSVRPIQYLHFQRLKHLHQNFQTLKFYTPSLTYIAWNSRADNKFFSDRRVRTAMTHALDRAAFVEKIEYNLAKIVSGPFYLKSWAYNPNIKPLPYDLEKAAQLLNEAGWQDNDGDGILDKNGLKFEFELIINAESASFTQLASIIQANLKKLFIEAKIKAFEWSVFLERKRHGEFDATMGAWHLSVDPDQYSLWHSSQVEVGNNQIGYANEEVDKLLEAGRREFERNKRQEIYWKIHEILHHDQPYTFIDCYMQTYVIAKRVENYEVSPYGLFEFFPGPLSWSLK